MATLISNIRLAAISLFLLLATICHAQDQSRIVFFRMDAEIGDKSSPTGEWRLYADKLKKDDEVLAKMRSSEVFIYTDQSARGSYSLDPKVSGANHSNILDLPALKGGIAFVRISLNDETPITARLELLSYSQFSQCYKQNAWLRKRFDEEGFQSLEALMKGFRILPMNRRNSDGEYDILNRNPGDTIYFDKRDLLTDREHATSFSIATSDTDGLFLIRDYYLPEGSLESSYRCQSLDSSSREGWYTSFNKKGHLISRGRYQNQKKEGLWEVFYDTLGNHVWYSNIYKNGKRDGLLTSYYLSGKVKREELHWPVIDTEFPKVNGTSKVRYRDIDSIKSGHCYDEMGKEIPFTPFEMMPRAAYNLSDYISHNIRYPSKARRESIQGRVIIQFVINELGQVQEASVVKAVSPELDQEALKVIQEMPSWKPGVQDDKAVKVYFTLPITFRLD